MMERMKGYTLTPYSLILAHLFATYKHVYPILLEIVPIKCIMVNV